MVSHEGVLPLKVTRPDVSG